MSTPTARRADRTQTVQNAWTNALRAEVLRVGSRDLAAVARVGVWLASYTDADGTNGYPARETLAVLAGCALETVTRALRVLESAGMLNKRRRPNASAVYQLLLPATAPDWSRHLHHYTDTRQRKARAAQKAREVEDQSRTASPDAVGTASPSGVPDSVPAGGSGQRPRTPSGTPASVPGRPRTASPDAVRTASPSGGYQPLPTYGRNQPLHHPAREAAARLPAPRGSAVEEDAADIGALVEAMRSRGMAVSWPLSDDERRALAVQLAAVGAPVLVEHAARIWRTARDTPYSARFFLPQWLSLAAPPPGAPPNPLDALGGPSRTNEYLADMAAIAAEMRQNGT